MSENQHKYEEEVSVREANQGFSKLIARVEQGSRFVVTKNNKPVAHISPADETDVDKAVKRNAAIDRLERLMSAGRRSKDGWTYVGAREDLHGRDI